jgi:AcrR family transcriptional regulator
MNFEEFCQNHKLTKKQLFSEFYDLFEETIEIKNKAIAVDKLGIIITATFKLSASQSFANMSLRELSKETGISMGGLYAYIQNKQQLALYIHKFLNYYADKVILDIESDTTGNTLIQLIKAHVFLSEILQSWFFFAFMESKNLDKNQKKLAINSELSVENKIILAIKKGIQKNLYHQDLDAETIASLIKPMLHDWYLKRWKYKQRQIDCDSYCSSMIKFIEHGIKI